MGWKKHVRGEVNFKCKCPACGEVSNPKVEECYDTEYLYAGNIRCSECLVWIKEFSYTPDDIERQVKGIVEPVVNDEPELGDVTKELFDIVKAIKSLGETNYDEISIDRALYKRINDAVTKYKPIMGY